MGALYFCGEHPSRDHQGSMNGAAEAGEQVADAVIAHLAGGPAMMHRTQACRRHSRTAAANLAALR